MEGVDTADGLRTGYNGAEFTNTAGEDNGLRSNADIAYSQQAQTVNVLDNVPRLYSRFYPVSQSQTVVNVQAPENLQLGVGEEAGNFEFGNGF